MSTPCTLDRAEKLHSLLELSEARKAYLRSLYASEMAWQDFQRELSFDDNALGDEERLGATSVAAGQAHNATKPFLAAMTAKHEQCLALGLDLGLDHLITKAVAA
jgi:hypothetical protein